MAQSNVPARPARWRLAGVTVVGLVALAVAMVWGIWSATAPDALRDPGAGATMDLAVGETAFVGHLGVTDSAIELERVEALATSGLVTEVWICDRVQDEAGSADATFDPSDRDRPPCP